MGIVLAQGPAAGGHGVLPVPPDRARRPRHPALRGGARRRRDPAQQRRRALHGALRPDHQGPRAARHGRARDGQRGARGPRLRAGQGLRPPRPDAPRAAERIDDEAAGHHRVRAHLPGRRALHRADAGRSRPRTTRWAASRPTSTAEVLRRQRHTSCPACTPPARSRACRCTAPTGWAPTRCSTSTSSAAGPASTPRSTRWPSTAARAAAGPRGRRRRPGRVLRDAAGSERVAAIRAELQATMDLNAQVYRTEGSLKQALSDIAGAQGALRRASSIQDKGRRFNTDLLEAVELGFLLDLAEVLVVSALARNGVPRRPLPRGLPDPRRRELHAAHDGLPRGRRG